MPKQEYVQTSIEAIKSVIAACPRKPTSGCSSTTPGLIDICFLQFRSDDETTNLPPDKRKSAEPATFTEPLADWFGKPHYYQKYRKYTKRRLNK